MRRRFTTALLATAALAASVGLAGAQTALRIGLAEDPDVLDPTLARTYVGRIVFSALCDKLFDIDEKLNVVPQLALSHDTSDDGKAVTIKLRPNVKFHDGEPLDAEAAKFSFERHLTMQGSFRRPEITAIEKVEVVDPLTIRLHLKSPFSPLIAQLTDRAGMMVSPKAAKEAGDKFGQKPVCAGPYKFVERVQQDRIVLEKFADYWDKANVHIDRITYVPINDFDRAARQSQIGPARPHRAAARDRPQGHARRQPPEGGDDHRAWLPGHHHQRRQGRGGEEPARPGPAGAPRLRARHRPRRAEPGRLQRRVHGREPVGQPEEPLVPGEIPGAEARRRAGQEADPGGGREDARSRSTSWSRTTPRRGRWPRFSSR